MRTTVRTRRGRRTVNSNRRRSIPTTTSRKPSPHRANTNISARSIHAWSERSSSNQGDEPHRTEPGAHHGSECRHVVLLCRLRIGKTRCNRRLARVRDHRGRLLRLVATHRRNRLIAPIPPRPHGETSTMSTGPKQVLILGGGFAGVYAARYLEKLLRPEEASITLVNRENYANAPGSYFGIDRSDQRSLTNSAPLRAHQSHHARG